MKKLSVTLSLLAVLALSCGQKNKNPANDPDIVLARPVADQAVYFILGHDASSLYDLYHPNYRQVFSRDSFTGRFRDLYPVTVNFKGVTLSDQSKTAVFLPYDIGLKNVCTFTYVSTSHPDRKIVIQVVIDNGQPWLSDLNIGPGGS